MDYQNNAKESTSPRGYYAGPVDSVESGSRIRDGVSHSEQVLSGIHEAIVMLEKRLDTVLTPVPPASVSTASQNKQQMAVSSHLHGRMQILNEGYEDALRRIHALIGRVEV